MSEEAAQDVARDGANSVVEEPARALGRGSSDFWECGEGMHALDDPTPFGQENALEKLGKPPFEKTVRGRFRVLGYLATVYEHVSQDVGRGLGSDNQAAGGQAEDQGTA